MQRCFQLAQLGLGNVAPNPVVGAVLVHQNKIIGEGYHRKYGGPHAEVECINSVKEEYKHLIHESTLYVSLEPCAHFGKTPPCADLIVNSGIKKVIIGTTDPFIKVSGKGIEKLRAARIEVEMSSLEKDAYRLNKRFFTFHTKLRPYIILKWAQTGDGKIARNNSERLYITNTFTNRLVHRWRSEEQSILVGTNTAAADDPSLTARLWPGNNPVRIVIDRSLRLPTTLQLFDKTVNTIVLNLHKNEEDKNLLYFKLKDGENDIQLILNALYHLNIQSVLIEGGAGLLQSFINEGAWDEARIITNETLIIGEGLQAPKLNNHQLVKREQFQTDTIISYNNTNQPFNKSTI